MLNQNKEDRLKRYFVPLLKEMVFSEFSENFINKMGLSKELLEIPIPFKAIDFQNSKSQEGLKTIDIARNMIFVIGCDLDFEYAEQYRAFLNTVFDEKIADAVAAEANEYALKGEFERACIGFRACLYLKKEHRNGLYGYAMVCRELYLNSEDEEYVGRFKAEAFETFEYLSLCHPDFSMAHYHLGYGYLNLGLYIKAKLAWEEFLELNTETDLLNEIRQRVSQLEDPVRLEQGNNAVISGRYEEGKQILLPYTKTNYMVWWPLSYYLGISHNRLGEYKEAIECFKRVLTMNGSHLESMEELVSIYRETGDSENENKYVQKIQIVKENILKDKE